MGTAINHPVSDRVKPLFAIFDIRALWRSGLTSECPDVKNYKWWLNTAWHRMLYSCHPYGNSGRQKVKNNHCEHDCHVRVNNNKQLRGCQIVPERGGSRPRLPHPLPSPHTSHHETEQCLNTPQERTSWMKEQNRIVWRHCIQESHAVAGKPRDAAVNSDRYRVCWHFAGAISVSRMQSVSGCTVYA